MNCRKAMGLNVRGQVILLPKATAEEWGWFASGGLAVHEPGARARRPFHDCLRPGPLVAVASLKRCILAEVAQIVAHRLE